MDDKEELQDELLEKDNDESNNEEEIDSNNEESSEELSEIEASEEASIENNSSEETLIEEESEEDSPNKHKLSPKVLNKKIIIRIIILVLCSLIYLGINLINLHNGARDIQTRFAATFIRIIMYVCYGLSIIGIIFLILILCVPKIKEWYDNLKYHIRNTIYNVLDWTIILPLCTVIASICFSFFFTLGTVDGSSMYPNFSSEDTVFINYLAKIDRGDVVVAYITVDDNYVSDIPNYQKIYPEYYIKRVIGVSGDSVTWKDGILTVNGNVVDESSYFTNEQLESYKKYCANPFNGTFKYKENGESKSSMVIPDGYFFVMGDNRNASRDSRMIGLIPKNNIIGEVKLRFYGYRIERV